MRPASRVLAVLLCLFTLAEVNYPQLVPQSQLAIFATLALVVCFLERPAHPRLAGSRVARAVDVVPALVAAGCGAFVVTQTQPAFRALWLGGLSLGNRAGQEPALDVVVGVAGLLVVLEATRRTLGLALPLLSLAFLAYAWCGPWLPDWLFPHRGYDVARTVAQTWLHTQGVFGTALRVMFAYVFLFVLFGAFLQRTGATQFVIDFAERALGATTGGPAKVAVLSSGMMGSLSGSAVANTATTGTFTIPMMRSVGFSRELAAGVEAAASSGGALVPPVMGAGAYMMLEIVTPPVTYVEIIRAALLPAVLYYLSLFSIVHFMARRAGVARRPASSSLPVARYEALVFAGSLGVLLALLLSGFTVFRAATAALVVAVALAALHRRTRVSRREFGSALIEAGRDGVPLVAAAACVGIIIGVVTLTGIGTKLPTAIMALAQDGVFPALVLIMVSSIILGMGLPSAVCYLLLATLVGPTLARLGIVPLAAHLFIFYFGLMSMVTPPVALAAYAAGSIAGANIMRASFEAFRIALVGFTLPYMFVFRPQLLMLGHDGETARAAGIVAAFAVAATGIVALAAALAGFLFSPVGWPARAALFLAAGLLLLPTTRFALFGLPLTWIDLSGAALFLVVAGANRRRERAAAAA